MHAIVAPLPVQPDPVDEGLGHAAIPTVIESDGLTHVDYRVVEYAPAA